MKDKQINILVTPEQKEKLTKHVDKIPGATLSAWCRDIILAELQKTKK